MKKTLSVFIMLIACAILVCGITLAYFYDSARINSTHFTTGSVKVEVDLENGDWGNWKPGNDKTITWYIKNTGTLDATLDVKIEKEWDINTLKASVHNSVYNDYPPEPTVNWSLKNDKWALNGDVYHYKATVAPGETIPLMFELSIDNISSAYEGADYNITLFVTATQVIDE